MRALDRKLVRELWQLKMQMLSICLVVATGIMTVLTMRGVHDSLVYAQQAYYAESRFADLWVSLVRAPDSLLPSIEAIPGIELVDTRVTAMATLDLDDLEMPAQGRFISIPESGRPVLNDILVQAGRYIEPGNTDEILISENFAMARGLRAGDSVRAVINGRARALNIVGIASSPEHSYAVPPGSLFPEDERYGIFWMAREALGPAFDMDGAFNEVVATLTPDADPQAVMRSVDQVLAPYGGLGSYLRERQISHQILESELDQNRVMGTAIPAIFLLVAAFLLHLVLGRLIATQRGEIAVLKSFGYSNREVGFHFLMFALVAVVLGSLLGAAGGIYLGGQMMAIYSLYFDIPALEFRLTPTLLMLAISVSLAGAVTGAWSSVRRAVRLPPAEAMRPEAPARFEPGPLERLGLGMLLAPNARMILRNLERKPLQALFSAIGVAMSVAILVIGMFMFDSINYMMDLQFRIIQREDVTLTFEEPVSDTVRFELARLEGVTAVETYRTVAARLHSGHLEEEVAVQGMEPTGRLRRIVNDQGREIPVPSVGLVLSDILAEELNVKSGDEVTVEWLEGKRKSVTVPIAGIVVDFIGVSAYMSQAALHKATGEDRVVSGAYLAVEESSIERLYSRLKQVPYVAGVSSPQIMLASFEEEMAQSMLVSASFLVGFASIIAVGVIYNGARISLSERGRELASLRVMGFHRREVAILLLGEQAVVTLLGLPLGYLAGYGLSFLLVTGFETLTYRIPFVFDSETYIVATIVVLFAALASGLAVRRRLDRFDLVEVLKTRE